MLIIFSILLAALITACDATTPIATYIAQVEQSALNGGLYPHAKEPTLTFDIDFIKRLKAKDTTAENAATAIARAITLVNKELPPEHKIRTVKFDQEASIIVKLVQHGDTFSDDCAGERFGCADSILDFDSGHTKSSTIYIADTYAKEQTDFLWTMVLHELLHALGIQGHVEHESFPKSVMNHKFAVRHTGDTLPPIDAEILKRMYR